MSPCVRELKTLNPTMHGEYRKRNSTKTRILWMWANLSVCLLILTESSLDHRIKSSMFLAPRYRNHISAFYCITTNETSVFWKEEFDVWMECPLRPFQNYANDQFLFLHVKKATWPRWFLVFLNSDSFMRYNLPGNLNGTHRVLRDVLKSTASTCHAWLFPDSMRLYQKSVGVQKVKLSCLPDTKLYHCMTLLSL
jgi:hypothetical protein